MNRRKVATPRRHMLRSIVLDTCGYLIPDRGQATETLELLPCRSPGARAAPTRRLLLAAERVRGPKPRDENPGPAARRFARSTATGIATTSAATGATALFGTARLCVKTPHRTPEQHTDRESDDERDDGNRCRLRGDRRHHLPACEAERAQHREVAAVPADRRDEQVTHGQRGEEREYARPARAGSCVPGSSSGRRPAGPWS